MRSPRHPLLVLALVGCGGQVSPAASTRTDAGAEPPFDASNAPTAVVLNCSGSAAPIAFKLPCAVGQGPLNVTECYALDSGPSPSLPVMEFAVPLAYLASHLNQPVDLPYIPAPPGGMPLVANGVPYGTTHFGTLTVSAVDTALRAYVGHVKGVEFMGTPDAGAPIVCSTADALIWAVPGTFY
jgi:hypothetical protein